MRTILINASIIISVFFTSCEKEGSETLNTNNVNIVVSDKGNFTISVKDGENTIDGASVYVYAYQVESRYLIFEGKTNASGNYSGIADKETYSCKVRAERGNRRYYDSKFFQILPDTNVNVELDPFLNVGDVKVKIVNTSDDAIQNINVALLPYSNYHSEINHYTFEEMMESAYGTGVTDEQGWVSFKDIPEENYVGSYDYCVLLYYSSSEYEVPSSYTNTITINIFGEKEKIITTSL